MTGLAGFLALVLFGAFIKCFTTLTVLRQGIGLTGAGFSIVTGALALALTLLVTKPQVDAAGGLDAVLRSQSMASLEGHFRPFMERHSDEKVIAKLAPAGERLAGKAEEGTAPAADPKAVPFPVLLLSFLVSELGDAFHLAVMILVPFLVADLVVANALVLLGVTHMDPELVSLPVKILLFFAVDGWTLVTQKLIEGYL